MVGIIVAVDKLVIQRRSAIVKTVRQLQAILNTPPRLSVVSDITESDFTDESLRFGADLDAYFMLTSLPMLGLAAGLGKIKSPLGFVSGIILPACSMVIWIYFILARRHFDQGARNTYGEEGSGENWSLIWRSIDNVLQDPFKFYCNAGGYVATI